MKLPDEFILQTYGRRKILFDKVYYQEFSEVFVEELFKFAFDKTQIHWTERNFPSRGICKIVKIYPEKSFVVRRCFRGGLVTKLTRDLFFRTSRRDDGFRSFNELVVLKKLRDQGCLVPLPIAAGVEELFGGFFYRCFLVTEFVENAKNLLDLLKNDQTYASQEITHLENLCFKSGQEAHRSLLNGVFHVDLHPGNVLVVGESIIYLLDFDKCRILKEGHSKEPFKNKLASRWRRALIKYIGSNEQVELFSTAFSRGLQSNV